MTTETEEIEHFSDDDIISRMIGEDTVDADDADTDDEFEEVDENEDTDETEGDDDGDNADDETDNSEDPETEIKIGDEVKKIKQSELAQLYQDKSYYTENAARLRTESRHIDDIGLFFASIYESKMQAAHAQVQKYAQFDDFEAYRRLSPEDFEVFKEGKKAAQAELNAITQEAQSYVQKMQIAKQALLKEQVPQAVVEIKRRLPDWTDTTYKDLQTFAISKGMDVSMFNEIIEPAAIEMMHMAMKYEQAQKAGKKKVAKKEVKAPKGVITKSETRTNSESTNVKKLMNRASKTHDDEDIISAMLAMKKQ